MPRKKTKPKPPLPPLRPKVYAFLAAIRVLPCVERAAAAAGINKSAHYSRLKRDPKYAEAFAEALQIGVDALSDTAVIRANEGWEEPVIYQGELCYPAKWNKKLKKFVVDPTAAPLTIRKIDNRLMEFILKNRHPEYRERIQVSGTIDLRDQTERINAGRQKEAEFKAARDKAKASRAA